LNVTFYGVRGSTPCSCDANRRYGGNTACVSVDFPGADPIVLDMGTGLRFWGATFPADQVFRGHALVTHLHWDHVQGLPFFAPVLRPGNRLDVYAPPPEDGTLEEAFDEFMAPPYFPVRVAELPGEMRFHPVVDTDFDLGDVHVTCRAVPHIGPTNGYRLERDGIAITYISDHQQPLDGSFKIPASVLELCEGADLVVHDAQYTAGEFEHKAHWGHCTVEYAVRVAAEAGARRLALFHHDPEHDDATIDAIVSDTRCRAEALGVSVMAASEGSTIALPTVAAAAR
jgi:phosphoribosyl 1,2-cyclic phosphodiesterase